MTKSLARAGGQRREGLGVLNTDLARGLDPLPDAEVADDPGEQEAQGQLPAQGPQMLDAIRDLQDAPPGEGEKVKVAPLWLLPRRVLAAEPRQLLSKGLSAPSLRSTRLSFLCPELGMDRQRQKQTVPWEACSER